MFHPDGGWNSVTSFALRLSWCWIAGVFAHVDESHKTRKLKPVCRKFVCYLLSQKNWQKPWIWIKSLVSWLSPLLKETQQTWWLITDNHHEKCKACNLWSKSQITEWNKCDEEAQILENIFFFSRKRLLVSGSAPLHYISIIHPVLHLGLVSAKKPLALKMLSEIIRPTFQVVSCFIHSILHYSLSVSDTILS